MTANELPLQIGLLCAWMGVAYHLAFFAAIKPAAGVSCAAFVLRAALSQHARS